MEPVDVIALGTAAAWASGLNLYATLLVLGLASATGHAALPAELDVLGHPMVLSAAGFMFLVEFFADKIPGVDTAWDTVHTFIRIPAGAVLAAAAMGDVSGPLQVAAALLGGGLAAGVHATKTGGRVILNTSPEPLTNWAASVSEDVVVVGGLWMALSHPVWFLVLLAAFVLLMIWLLPRIWRAVSAIARALTGWFKGERRAPWLLQSDPATSSTVGSRLGSGGEGPPNAAGPSLLSGPSLPSDSQSDSKSGP